MRVIRERQDVLSVKVTRRHRRLVERLAAKLTIQAGRRHTLTDVVEEAIHLLARKHGLKLED